MMCWQAPKCAVKRLRKYQGNHADHNQNQHYGEADTHEDELAGLTSIEVALSVFTRLHPDGGGQGATENLPKTEAVRLCLRVFGFSGVVFRVAHKCLTYTYSFSIRVTQ
jgi:hypothetical protein